MARKPEEEANHWPGFVDALSTIVMVITFLLILLGLTLFIMMQKIQSDASVVENTSVSTEEAGGATAEDQAQSDAKQQKQASASAAQTSQVSDLKEKLQEAQQEIKDLKERAEENAGAPKAPTGRSIASKSTELRQDDKIDTQDKLTILTRKVDEKVKIAVASQEVVQNDGDIRVTSAAVALQLDYEPDTTNVDDAAAEQVGQYFAEQQKTAPDARFEIRSIASSGVGSVSEARRKAYFRALTVRNILLQRGVAADRIATKISLPQPGEQDDRVVISMKPQ